MVTVKLYGTLNRFLPGGEGSIELDLGPPSTVGGLLERLEVPLGALDALLLNGQLSSPGAPLTDGDLLEAFPFLGGGSASAGC